jgi:hypothetical protein
MEEGAEIDKCPVGKMHAGHAGFMGGARPSKKDAGSPQIGPPPVGVGGSGWPCPKGPHLVLMGWLPLK